MKKVVLFDLAGTLVKMRPPISLVKINLLKRLSSKFVLGIITGARKAETTNILQKINISNFFLLVISKEDSYWSKPDKKLFLMIKEKLPAKNYVYVGDTKKDYLFAKNADIPFLYLGKRKLGIYQNKDINKILIFLIKNFPAKMIK